MGYLLGAMLSRHCRVREHQPPHAGDSGAGRGVVPESGAQPQSLIFFSIEKNGSIEQATKEREMA